MNEIVWLRAFSFWLPLAHTFTSLYLSLFHSFCVCICGDIYAYSPVALSSCHHIFRLPQFQMIQCEMVLDIGPMMCIRWHFAFFLFFKIYLVVVGGLLFPYKIVWLNTVARYRCIFIIHSEFVFVFFRHRDKKENKTSTFAFPFLVSLFYFFGRFWQVPKQNR